MLHLTINIKNNRLRPKKNMIFSEKEVKSILKFCAFIILPLIVGLLLLHGYSLYISLLKNINDIGKKPNNKNGIIFPKDTESSKNIKRLSYLKYTHQNGGEDSIYLIELVRIGRM